ncbi:hypothetical protein FJ444_02225 [Aestuariibacter sp. GS-14]|uniref:hypothetical protein n=1 Tax=Aestuariibacter sp. GS-14 TaxID=2590670 RepID=UPI001128DF40|nr:hypothetical protein [Aestuariibacter sp. GS-14]TPV62106.1 hypothetical protein FJ444_02225 [Aestuariibacter sp. GS-14]
MAGYLGPYNIVIITLSDSLVPNKITSIIKFISNISILLGCSLLVINLYGLTRDLRPEGLEPDVLRFGVNDVTISPSQTKVDIVRKPNESDEDYVRRLTYVLASGIAHLEWEEFEPDLYHQRVPIWENYILFLMGVITPIPEFKRYHYSNPHRSLERGIGICGDASMTLSGLLDEQDIKNKIITLPGHVMVEVEINGGKQLLDADYGVVLDEGGVEFYRQNPENFIAGFQTQLGRVNDGEYFLASGLQKEGYQVWNGTSHFITKKYYFEKFAYVAKWVLPIAMILLPLWWMRRRTQQQ